MALDLSMIGQNQPSTVPSQPQSFLQQAGGFIKNNLPTIGSVVAPLAAAALAPETGGLSLAALAAGGGALGEAGKEAASGESFNPTSIAEQGALGGVSEGVGGLVGGIVGKAGGALGDAFSKESDNLALKGLGANTNQLANFATKHADLIGGNTPDAVTNWINSKGLAGQGLDALNGRIDDLQGQFNSIAKSSGIKVDSAALQKNMLSTLEPILNSSDEGDVAIAQKVFKNFSNIVDKLGDNPTLEDLTNERQFYDSKAPYSLVAQDPEKYGPSKLIADTLRKTVQDTADNSGALTSSGTLKDAGKELSALYDLQSIAEKAQFKGVAKSTPGLTNYMASAALGNVAGPGGAAIGAAVPALLNNPTALAALSKGFGAAGDATGAIASKVGGALASPLGTATTQAVIGGGANEVNNSNQPSMPPTLTPSASSLPATPQLTGSSDLASQGVQAIQSGQPLNQSQYQALLEKDLAETGGRFSGQITAAYNAGSPAAVQGLGVASNAVNTLQDLYNTAGGAEGPIKGGIESALGNTGLTAQSVKSYNDQKTALGQEIISQIYGSSGTASDRDQVLNLIPAVNDPPQVAQSKMATLKALIQQRLSSLTGSTPSSVSSLTSGPSLTL